MNKTKSVVMTILLTIVIVLLCLVCVVPEFGVPFTTKKFNSVVSVIKYGSDLGGGYSAVYYPDGVLSADEYKAQKETCETKVDSAIRKYLGIAEDETLTLDELKNRYENNGGENKDVEDALYDLNEYAGKYVAYTTDNFADATAKNAAVYLEVNEVCSEKDGKYAVEDEFKENFNTAVSVMAKRFDKKNFGAQVVVKDGYTIEVSVPYTVEDPDSLFTQMGYTGEFMLRANEEVSSRPLLRAFGDHKISEYFKSASSTSSGTTGVVVLDMTTLGKDTVYKLTKTLKDNETDATLYFYIGETQVIGLGLSNEKDGIDQRTLYISGSFTPETAQNVGIVINSCIEDEIIDMALSVSSTKDYSLVAGKSNVTAVYIVFAVAMLAMFVYSVIRYKGLGVSHIFGYLSYLICMLMFVAFLPGMLMDAGCIVAIALTSVVMVLCNYYIFENFRKEFATGKTLTASVKAGYKRSLAPVLDMHILLFLASFILYFVGVGQVASFAYVALFGFLTSGISTLLLTRYYAYVMRGLVAPSKQHVFCGFKREVIEDDED